MPSSPAPSHDARAALSQIYHPNIDLEGHVCLNILREDWKPVFDINSVIYGVRGGPPARTLAAACLRACLPASQPAAAPSRTQIIYLFYEPNANDPLNHGALRAACPRTHCPRAARAHAHPPAPPPAEAAALMRDATATFEANVKPSLRGGTLRIASTDKGTVTSVTFPKLL